MRLIGHRMHSWIHHCHPPVGSHTSPLISTAPPNLPSTTRRVCAFLTVATKSSHPLYNRNVLAARQAERFLLLRLVRFGRSTSLDNLYWLLSALHPSQNTHPSKYTSRNASLLRACVNRRVPRIACSESIRVVFRLFAVCWSTIIDIGVCKYLLLYI